MRPKLDISRLRQFLTIPLYANAIYLMANVSIMSLLGFFFWIVVARFYSEADVGYSSAIISVIGFLTLLSSLGLNTSLVRFLPQTEKPEALINSCFTLGSLFILVVAGIFLAGLGFWSPALGFIRESAIFALVFIVFAILRMLSSLIGATFIAKRRAGFVLSQDFIFSLLKIPLPILFVLFFHSFGVVASWGIALGIAIAVSLLLFLPKVQSSYKPLPTLDLNLIKGIWRYSGSNYLANLLLASPALILPVMVVNLLGPESNAYFYVTWMMTNLLIAIPRAMSSSLFAEGSHSEGKLSEYALKSVKFAFLLLVPAVIMLILAGKWLLLAFGSSYSVNGLRLLWILSLSSLPLGITYIYASILRVEGRLKELIAIWGFIAVTVMVTSYLVMPSSGIIGIGYAWLGAHGISAIYCVLALRLWIAHHPA